MREERLNCAGLEVADLCGPLELLLGPFGEGCDRETVVRRRGVREIVAVHEEALDRFEERCVLVTHLGPPEGSRLDC